MIRRLHEELGIPLRVLIVDDDKKSTERGLVPLAKELVRRGWIEESRAKGSSAEQVVSSLLSKLGVREVEQAYFKRSLHLGTGKEIDVMSAQAWIARVLLRAKDHPARKNFRTDALNDALLSELPRLSWFENGPLLARDYLSKLGIALIVEEHLPGTAIDGGCALDSEGVPVIGLTLRHDRLDNFWFTLMHECAHILRHLSPGDRYVDDTEGAYEGDAKEVEANRIARDSLIPPAAWRASRAPKLKTEEAVCAFAQQLRVSPAIVAGRIRRESGNYNILSSLVGFKQVSKLLLGA
jgi:HTH-type transcriptional regulator/antitoxin HigA